MKYLLVVLLLWYNGTEIHPMKFIVPNIATEKECLQLKGEMETKFESIGFDKIESTCEVQQDGTMYQVL